MENTKKIITLLIASIMISLSSFIILCIVFYPLESLFTIFLTFFFYYSINNKNTLNNLYKEYEIKTEYVCKVQNKFYREFGKRLFDIIVSLIGLIITAPIIIMFSILIILESPGSPFYLQRRVGLNGSYFNIYKLRSMKKNAEKSGPQWASRNDPRVTKVGGFIRKTRIDEFPQFLNVLKGEMSIIGPRPERPFFTAKFHNDNPDFANRLAVKPGLTGWAQINGGYDLTPEQKLRFDLYYINNLNFIYDLKILIKTIKIIITGKGAR